ncbi:unnamed protein product [Rotaria socialis]|nr:unnamed protein product [Rotaria socialis]CAF3530571.1 unnamed protein product [Rotaria socialis]CAF3650864.1 unnamed protein product [Rotaria socialis]CAF4444748.1 unnamed protein product [Rotaria socialis]CAF4588644.1 unnamed protein product [Rotaria socialis]
MLDLGALLSSKSSPMYSDRFIGNPATRISKSEFRDCRFSSINSKNFRNYIEISTTLSNFQYCRNSQGISTPIIFAAYLMAEFPPEFRRLNTANFVTVDN